MNSNFVYKLGYFYAANDNLSLKAGKLNFANILDKDKLLTLGAGYSLGGGGGAIGNNYTIDFANKDIRRITRATIGKGNVVIANDNGKLALINRDITKAQNTYKNRDVKPIHIKYTKVNWTQLKADIQASKKVYGEALNYLLQKVGANGRTYLQTVAEEQYNKFVAGGLTPEQARAKTDAYMQALRNMTPEEIVAVANGTYSGCKMVDNHNLLQQFIAPQAQAVLPLCALAADIAFTVIARKLAQRGVQIATYRAGIYADASGVAIEKVISYLNGDTSKLSDEEKKKLADAENAPAVKNYNPNNCPPDDEKETFSQAGKRREQEYKKELEEMYPAKDGYKVLEQRMLRGADGKKAVDLKTGTGRRLDFVVVDAMGNIVDVIEVTSKFAEKGPQLEKTHRIRFEQGKKYIRDPKTKEAIEIPDACPERTHRRK
jgi:hypothetical protein